MLASLLEFANDECGQGLVEYALILGFVAIVAIVGLTAIGTKVNNSLNSAGNQI